MTPQLKKNYAAPQLTVHGDVAEITLQGTARNSDTPEGISNTAYYPKPA